jgi:hypothetical protein
MAKNILSLFLLKLVKYSGVPLSLKVVLNILGQHLIIFWRLNYLSIDWIESTLSLLHQTLFQLDELEFPVHIHLAAALG